MLLVIQTAGLGGDPSVDQGDKVKRDLKIFLSAIHVINYFQVLRLMKQTQ